MRILSGIGLSGGVEGVATGRGANVSFVEIKILLIAIYSHEHLVDKGVARGGFKGGLSESH